VSITWQVNDPLFTFACGMIVSNSFRSVWYRAPAYQRPAA
jgi:hypothetical protein